MRVLDIPRREVSIRSGKADLAGGNPASSRRVRCVTERVEPAATGHGHEPHEAGLAGRLNWLRAGVLGANDGIVSVAGIVVGVAGATPTRGPVFTAGLAGLVAGAVSMALGEYVSVSSQRDSEQALLAKERAELRDMPELELAELTEIYERKGLRPETARQVAVELTEHDVLTAHAEAELGVHPDDLASPGRAALASAVAFVLGALLPLVAILLPPVSIRVWVTVAAVLLALALAGTVSARIGGSSPAKAVARVVVGGAAGLALTWGIGYLFGTAIG
jgi:VIT1/CCC1 family predicted Fe2+/Mn2+ transporter